MDRCKKEVFSPRAMLNQLIFENERCCHCNKRLKFDLDCWLCVECSNHVICKYCHVTNNHEHVMERREKPMDSELTVQSSDMLKLLLDDDSPSLPDQRTLKKNSADTFGGMSSLERRVQLMAHASHCRDDRCLECRQQVCQQMKNVMRHNETCQDKIGGNCLTCRQLVYIFCFHARKCERPNCPVTMCMKIRQTHEQKQQRQTNNLL